MSKEEGGGGRKKEEMMSIEEHCMPLLALDLVASKQAPITANIGRKFTAGKKK